MNKTINCTDFSTLCSLFVQASEKPISDTNLSNATWLTNEYGEVKFLRYNQLLTIIFCIGYLLIFVIGAVGNAFVVIVIYKVSRMRTVTNYFIVNLALADGLVIIFCLPGTLISNIITPWIMGDFVCKVMSYMQGVSVSASIYTLVAISIDRFTAICFLKREITPEMCKVAILVLWIYCLVLSSPWALYFTTVPMFPHSSSFKHLQFGQEFLQCTEKWPDESSKLTFFIVAHLLLCYILPLIAISICYIFIWIKVWKRRLPGELANQFRADLVTQRSRIKVVKMILAVVVFFALSWLPLYIISGISLITGSSDDIPSTVRPISQWLGLSNSCINPILYAFFNRKFREEFRIILGHKRTRHRQNQLYRLTSMTSETRRKTRTYSIKMEEIVREQK